MQKIRNARRFIPKAGIHREVAVSSSSDAATVTDKLMTQDEDAHSDIAEAHTDTV